MKAKFTILLSLLISFSALFAHSEGLTNPQQNGDIVSFTKNIDCKVYPTSVETNLSIDLNIEGTARIEITNLIGNVYIKKNTTENTSLDLSSLPSGMYLVNIYVGDAKITKRIYKQ